MIALLAKIKKEKDLSPGLLLLAGAILVLAKLLLASAQQVYLDPDGAVLDDMVMYNSAVSVAQGGWLGLYDWKVLAKHSFFSLWVAGLHTAGIPYLLGGQLLWAGASAAGAAALRPLTQKRWPALLLFFLLLFNPASLANAAPYGFVSRVYRDNIYPALCLLALAGVLGYALRYAKPGKQKLLWLVLAGTALGAGWIAREDGWWLVPFMTVGFAVVLFFALRQSAGGLWQKARQSAWILLPPALALAVILGWCQANYQVYGRFILNDFSTGEFADAYGAMTRIDHQNWHPKIAVPRDVRRQLYDKVPLFTPLEPLLESENFLDRYAMKDEVGRPIDYSSGAFYWALREAVAQLGHYDSPQKSQAYFTQLARDINLLCDTGVIAAGPARSSVSPPLKSAYVGPVLREGLYSVWFSATFRQTDARSMFSPGGNNPVFYQDKLQPMEEFLHEKALTVTRENSELPYFGPRQKLSFLLLDAVRYAYGILTPLALAAALFWQVRAAGRVWANLRQRKRDPQFHLVWLMALGLLGNILLRAFMIAFVTVSSFTIGTYIMYLAPIHPMMLLYAYIGCSQLVQQRKGTTACPIS